MSTQFQETTGFFIPPEICNDFQLFFLTVVYGFLLFKGSGFISDGSELLLLVPSIAGMVGSVVLPVLGVVPDSLMVLFSGMGDNVQEKVSVGMGALAGSTIMLLTVPWFLAVLGGRVALDPLSGLPQYAKQRDDTSITSLTSPGSLYQTGVFSSPQVRSNAIFMVVSASLYLFIQIPALLFGSMNVSGFAFIGFLICLGAWVVYIFQQYKAGKVEDSIVGEIVAEARIEAIRTGEVTLLGAMQSLLEEQKVRESLERPLMRIPESLSRQLRSILSPFFKQYQDDTGTISFDQFITLMRDLGQSKLSTTEMIKIFNSADGDSSGTIDFEEFVKLMLRFIRDFDIFVDTQRYYRRSRRDGEEPLAGSQNTYTSSGQSPTNAYDRIAANDMNGASGGDGPDEAEDMPEDLENLTPEEQQSRIKWRSLYLMGLGTLLVLVFTDPAIDVLSEISKRANINPFFVSFVLAPLASNASEVIASYNYSLKKTRRTMKVALTTLEGAACMNNTLCLATFLGVIYFQGLSWTFTPETVAILFVQAFVGYLAIKRNVFRLCDALLILLLYPCSLLIVSTLKHFGTQN